MTTIYDAAILLVDDNPDLLTLVTDNLRTAGYKSVYTAADCAAARAAFAAHRPDLMILDINLPDGDGFGLFRTLRAESDVPALFLSARDADADRLFGLGLGADDYLTKPFLTYDAVCEAVWGADYYGYENSLNVHIRHLREKIEPDPGHPQWLLTVRGIGYRLTGEV